MEKLFSAKVVGINNYLLSIMLFAFIGGCIVLLLIMLTPIDGQLACYIFLVIILLTVVAVLFSKNGLSIKTSNEKFFVYEDHLEIGQLIFPFIELADLEFSFTSFVRMKKHAYEPNPEADYENDVEDGTNNSVSFLYRNQTYNYSFLVESQQRFFVFVQMLEQLYMNQINFLEKNWYGKTFMMRNVTDEQYQELKQAYT
jgi:hypothetical protein